MTPAQFVQAPLQGKLSVSRVFWLYGVVGSLVYGLLEFFIDPANAFLIRLYTVGAYAYSAYVIVGTCRCAANCRTAGVARFVRISAIVSLMPILSVVYMHREGRRFFSYDHLCCWGYSWSSQPSQGHVAGLYSVSMLSLDWEVGMGKNSRTDDEKGPDSA